MALNMMEMFLLVNDMALVFFMTTKTNAYLRVSGTKDK